MAYGQTGSGKTFTLFGHKNKNQIGLFNYIINSIVNKEINRKKISCCFMQIYNEKVTDLISNATVSLM